MTGDLFSGAAETGGMTREDETMSDGAPITPWQRTVIAEWHRRHPKPRLLNYGRLTVREVARGVLCARCGTPSVMFPGETNDFPECYGYCICPKCSQPKSQVIAL